MEAINLPQVHPGQPVLASHINAIRQGLQGLGVTTDAEDSSQMSTLLGTLTSRVPSASSEEAFGEDVRVKKWVVLATDSAFKDNYEGAQEEDDGNFTCPAIWLGTSLASARGTLGIGSKDKIYALDINFYTESSSLKKYSLPAQEITDEHFKPNGTDIWNDGYVRLPIRDVTANGGLYGFKLTYKAKSESGESASGYVLTNCNDPASLKTHLKEAFGWSDVYASDKTQLCATDDPMRVQADSRIINIASGTSTTSKTCFPFELEDLGKSSETNDKGEDEEYDVKKVTHKIWSEGSLVKHGQDSVVQWKTSKAPTSDEDGNVTDPLLFCFVRRFNEQDSTLGETFEFFLASELEAEMTSNPGNYYMPLYEVDSSLSVVCDLRPMPRMQVFDTLY